MFIIGMAFGMSVMVDIGTASPGFFTVVCGAQYCCGFMHHSDNGSFVVFIGLVATRLRAKATEVFFFGWRLGAESRQMSQPPGLRFDKVVGRFN